MSKNGWLQKIEENPGHSEWYIERFRSMAAEGRDLDGEARFVDAMVPRAARILDAGCGPGRVGGRLATLGHHVVGVDIDPALIAAAEADHPGPTWLARDLSELDLAADEGTSEATDEEDHGTEAAEEAPTAGAMEEGIPDRFDVIVSAGNVMTFLDPATRREVLRRLLEHLAPDGRIVIGFGAERGYEFEEFFADATAVGLKDDLKLSTWDLQPFDATSTYLVAVLTPR